MGEGDGVSLRLEQDASRIAYRRRIPARAGEVTLPFESVQHAPADRVATATLEAIFPGLGAITREVREAAHLVGADGLVFWRRIGLPILAPSLISVFIMLFANAMGTYATAWALVGGSANLVTIRIGELTAGDVFSDPNLADALAMLLVICLAALIMVEQFVIKPRAPNA